MLVVGVTEAKAQEDAGSANYLMPACYLALQKSAPNGTMMVREGHCTGAVSGVWDTAFSFGVICSPPTATLAQGMRVVVQFISESPHRSRHYRFFEASKRKAPSRPARAAFRSQHRLTRSTGCCLALRHNLQQLGNGKVDLWLSSKVLRSAEVLRGPLI